MYRPRSVMNGCFAVLHVVPLFVLAGCVTQQRTSNQRDVVPILEDKCVCCHMPPEGRGYAESGLDMNAYTSIMEGTVYGPVIVPGDSLRSTLNMVVQGARRQIAPHTASTSQGGC